MILERALQRSLNGNTFQGRRTTVKAQPRYRISQMISMVSVLIVYDTQTGNTEKMAQHVAKGAKSTSQAKVFLKRAKDTTLQDLQKADVIIVGSPTYYGLMSAAVKDLFDRSVKIHGKLEGKVGAAFTSSGGTASGAETTILSILQAMLVHGMIIQGRHGSKHYGAAAVGSPDDQDITDCEDLGKRAVQLASLVKSQASAEKHA